MPDGARLQTEAAGIVPEEVVVLQTVGPVEDFIVAVRNIDGLEWLGEIEEEDISKRDVPVKHSRVNFLLWADL